MSNKKRILRLEQSREVELARLIERATRSDDWSEFTRAEIEMLANMPTGNPRLDALVSGASNADLEIIARGDWGAVDQIENLELRDLVRACVSMSASTLSIKL